MLLATGKFCFLESVPIIETINYSNTTYVQLMFSTKCVYIRTLSFFLRIRLPFFWKIISYVVTFHFSHWRRTQKNWILLCSGRGKQATHVKQGEAFNERQQ